MNFRSKFEETVYNNVLEKGQTVEYEPFSLGYLIKGNYYPDFVLPNGIIVEAKGYFDSRARAKMIAVKKFNPDLDIRMFFMNSRTKVRKGSKLTYADWCNKYNFPFAEGSEIPEEWFAEENKESVGED